MKYYEARRTSDPSVVGDEWQFKFAADERNVSALSELESVFKANWATGIVTALSKSVQPIRACITDKAILTSFAYGNRALMNCPFAVTDQVKEMLSSLSLRPCIFHPLELENSNVQYSLFHYPTVLNDAIVFPASRFFTGSSLGGPKTYHAIASQDDHLAFIKSPGGAMLRPDYIEVTPGLLGVFDVLAFRFGRMFFSDRLVVMANELKLSGLNFLLASDDAHPNRIHFTNTGLQPGLASTED